MSAVGDKDTPQSTQVCDCVVLYMCERWDVKLIAMLPFVSWVPCFWCTQDTAFWPRKKFWIWCHPQPLKTVSKPKQCHIILEGMGKTLGHFNRSLHDLLKKLPPTRKEDGQNTCQKFVTSIMPLLILQLDSPHSISSWGEIQFTSFLLGRVEETRTVSWMFVHGYPSISAALFYWHSRKQGRNWGRKLLTESHILTKQPKRKPWKRIHQVDTKLCHIVISVYILVPSYILFNERTSFSGCMHLANSVYFGVY